jgi:hypothetical protein
MEASSYHQGKEDIMIKTRTWAIAGVSAALILIPVGAANATTTTSDATVTTSVERVQLHADRQAIYGALGVHTGGMFGAAYGDQTRGQQAGDQLRNQVRDPAQDPSGDYTGDQVRDQLRDTANCDGTGPTGTGPIGDGTGRGGVMGGRG